MTGNLQGIGWSMSAQNAAAAAQATGLARAVAGVSALTKAQFAARAQMHQAANAIAAG